jgi:AAA+ ATPase superfamily predicted ATPase
MTYGEPRPMRAILGGIPALEDIVGREVELDQVLGSFVGHGALLTGDRRFGKTSLTRLVEAACGRAGHRVIRISAERSSFEDFVDALADEFLQLDGLFKQAIRGWQASLQAGPLTLERTVFALPEPGHASADRSVGPR